MTPLPPSYDAAIAETLVRLRARYGARLQQVVMFGSYAWGQPHEYSDVDLCVLIDGITDHATRRDAMGIVIDVGLERDVPLSPLVWSTDEWNDRLAKEFAIAEDIRDRGVPL